MSPATKPTILLVHGAFHGSWCWKYLTPTLEALGYPTETLDMPSASGIPGSTQFDDAAHVRSIVDSLLRNGKRVVILAHSYGGLIASAALAGLSKNNNDTLIGLIDLSAFILPGGIDHGALIRSLGGSPYMDWDTPAEGLVVTKDPKNMFYAPDVPDDLAEWAIAQLHPQSMTATNGIVPPQAWEDETYTGQLGYIRCTADLAVKIEGQDKMIEGAGGKERWVTRTLEGAGHSPFLSRPNQLAAVVDEIVEEFEAKLR
jgi:pimeloyl-ACP methyl ester carboxylesterase